MCSNLLVLPEEFRIFRLHSHSLLTFEILFLEAYRFQNSEGLDSLKNTPLSLLANLLLVWFRPLRGLNSPYIHYIIYSLYAHYMFTIYSLYIHYIFTTYSPYIHYTFRDFREIFDLLANLLLVYLSPLWSSNSNVANDFVCRFRPVKPVLLRDSRIFRFHLLLNFRILFLEAYCSQNSEGLDS